MVNGRIENLETIKAGIPIESLLGRGLTPFAKGQVSYNGRSAKYFRFRSSSGLGSGPTSLDFGVIANQAGIIEVAFPLSSNEERQLWETLTGDR